MAAKTYYYARVSSQDQNLARQLAAFRELGAEDHDIITDKQSGKDLERPGYLALRNTILRPGDTLVIKSLSRLSRSKSDITQELRYYKERNIRVKILDIPTTMTDFPAGQEAVQEMVNNILIEVLGTMAQAERDRILQRQREGMAAAQAAGRTFGRPRLPRPENWEQIYNCWKEEKISASEAIRQSGLSHYGFYVTVQRYEQEKK